MSPFRLFRLSLLIAASAFAGCAQLPDGKTGADADGLHNAIVADHVDYVKAAVTSGAVNVNQKIPAPAYAEGTPLLTIAARAGSLGVMRYLISAGADVNLQTPAGETPLMLATYFHGSDRAGTARENHEKAARLLVESGASLENDPGNYTPLAYAAYQGHDELVKFLLARGARVDGYSANGFTYVNTPLMMAAMQGHKGTALTLLRAGANAKIRKHEGHTAAELADKHLGKSLLTVLKCAEQLQPRESFSSRCEGDTRSRAVAPAANLQPVSLER